MKRKIGVYMELSDVVDTRLNLMSMMFPKLADDMISKDIWSDRLHDGYEYVSSKLFRYMYKNRNKSSLAIPRPTRIMSIVNEVMTKSKHMLETMLHTDKVDLYLNIYPYELSAVEIEYIQNTIQQSLVVKSNIHVVSISDLTPEWILSHVTVMFMYDGMSWVDKISTLPNINNLTMPEVLLITPGMEEILSNNTKISQDVLDEIALSISPIIRVEFCTSELFSATK